ncbi:MAG: YoaK family protein [Hyphomonadaceae bacterium]
MIRYPRRYWIVAACLAAIAGFIDAAAFVHLGGFFVSFMSGNSTRLAVGVIEAPAHAVAAGSLIAMFVLGVMLGSVTNRRFSETASVRVVALVAAILALAALLAGMGYEAVAVGLLAVAMGAENAVFKRDGEVGIGLTYMTGTLVRFGQRLAEALTGGASWGWLPYLLLWLGLVAGAVAGAWAYAQLQLGAIWIAAAAMALLAAILPRLARRVD